MKTSRPPGRPPNNLKAAQALVEDNLLQLAEKALQLAKMGDTAALGMLLDRVWPPPAYPPVRLEPASIRKAVARGQIPAEHGVRLLDLASAIERLNHQDTAGAGG